MPVFQHFRGSALGTDPYVTSKNLLSFVLTAVGGGAADPGGSMRLRFSIFLKWLQAAKFVHYVFMDCKITTNYLPHQIFS